MPYPDQKVRWLPCLIYLAFMMPLSWIHWTGFVFLLLLMLSREEWNLYLLPAYLLALLPSLYMAQISWSLFFAVTLSYPLLLKADWPRGPSVLWYSTICLALLAFFAGPLAPVIVGLAIFIYLPRKISFPVLLIFLLLLALPLGRSDWKTWLGQVSSSKTPIVMPLQPLPGEAPLPDSAPSLPSLLHSSRTEHLLFMVFQGLLFLMFALLLALLLRLLWLMRRNQKPFLHSILLLLLILSSAMSGIFFFRWLGQVLSSRVFKEPSLLPLFNNPDQFMPVPLPGSEPPPLQDMPSIPPSEAVSEALPFRGVLSYALTILFMLAVCFFLFKLLHYIWRLPALSKAHLPQEDPNPCSRVSASSPDWASCEGEELLKKGYETLRKEYFPGCASLTPLELEQKQNQDELHQLTEAYISVCYAGKKLNMGDQVIIQWLGKWFKKI